MKKRIYGSVILILLVAVSLFAGERDCLQNLGALAAVAEQKLGAEVNYKQSRYGYLGEGESFTIKTTCYNTVTYVILAAGGDDAKDIGIEVYDGNGNLVSKDADDSNLALASFAPRWTGTFYFKVKLYSSTSSGDYVGYVRAYVYH